MELENGMNTEEFGYDPQGSDGAGQDSGHETEDTGRAEDGGADDGTQQETEGKEPQENPAEEYPGRQNWKNQQNAENAQRRREAEQRQRQRYFAEFAAGLTDPVTQKPFESEEAWSRWKQNAAIAAQAQKAGVEPEAAQRLVDSMRDTIRQTDPEFRRMVEETQAARRQQAEAMQQRVFAQDLAAIRKIYPDEKAKSVTELGDEYMAMMATGQVDAVSAYEAVRAKRQRTAPKPPSTGKIRSGAAGQGAYYTREQVNAMSDEQIEEHFDDIRRSMAMWK